MPARSSLRASAAISVMLLTLAAVILGSCTALRRLDAAGRDSLAVNVPRVLNLRVHGTGDITSPPILRIAKENGQLASGIGNDQLTIEFEMQTETPPDVMLQLIHCDHNWVPTQNVFIQDPIRLQTTNLFVERAPIGVTRYDYMLSVAFPSRDDRIEITASGNYRAQIVDYYNRSRVLAEGRFFVVQSEAEVDVAVYSDFYESAQTESVQHGLKVRVETEPEIDMFGSQIIGVDLYRKGAWYSPIVASDDSAFNAKVPGVPWIEWYPSFSGKTVAVYSNLPAGNEHRLLDLSDLLYYPSTGAVLSTPLSDLPRREFNAYDNNGVIAERYVPLSDADYVDFEFRLDLKGYSVKEDIFVVGTFNNWLPEPEWQMHYDEDSRFYVARGLIPRAFHEYEYVVGEWDAEAGVLRDADATLLEGNLTAATHPFYAFVYYRDITSGGYDKIIGAAVDISGTLR